MLKHPLSLIASFSKNTFTLHTDKPQCIFCVCGHQFESPNGESLQVHPHNVESYMSLVTICNLQMQFGHWLALNSMN